MNHDDEPQFAAYLGVDWADKKHDLCLQASCSTKREHSVLEHSPEAIAQWARKLRQRFDGKPIAVAVELARGPIVSALQKYDFFVLYPINPNSLASYRDAWAPSGAKDDPTDAELALDMLHKHRDKLRALRPQSVDMRALAQLVEARRKLVNDKVRLTNRITAALKEYFPQPLQWFEDKGTTLFCDFLERWPSAIEARRARRDTLERFLREHHVHATDTVQRRIEAIKQVQALTEDPGVVVPAQLLVQTHVAQLRVVLDSIKRYDQEIKQLAQRHSDYVIFDSFPAAAEVFAPRLLVAFGEDRERYHSAEQVQRYAGIAPVTERSGNKHWVHWRYKCPTFLRQSFVEWAALTIPRSFWAGAYYRQQRDKGASHNVAVRALAFKWTRILFRCWKQRTPYDESKYLNAMRKRGSTLLASLTNSTAYS